MAMLAADAITDMKTTSNTLSFWVIDSIDALDDVVVALATGSKITSLEAMDLVWVDEASLINDGFEVRSSLGDTAATILADTHRDVCSLTYSSLGQLAMTVFQSINAEQCKKVSKPDVKKCVERFYRSGGINMGRCSEKLAEQIKKIIAH